MAKFKHIVRIADADPATVEMFRRHDWLIHGTDTDEAPHLLVFTGGSDVSPSYYGEKNIASTCDPTRDAFEAALFETYKDIPKVGICRGGQFLNVMSGGKMYQDINGHGRYHTMIDTLFGKEWFVSSTHHQMMRPSDKGEIIGYATESSYAIRADGDDVVREEPTADVEVVWYPHTKSLCFQPHPEYYDAQETELYFFKLLYQLFAFGGS